MTIKLGDYDLCNNVESGVQAIFDLCHPIGEIYVQYGGASDPNTLYNNGTTIVCSWTDITTNYADRYFKASTTSGAGTNQGEELPNIWGTIRAAGINNYKWNEGCFEYGYEQRWGEKSGGYDELWLESFVFSANRYNSVYKDGGAVRPKTSTIKIWKRIG